MSKQDRQGARTVADLERRLNTRKTFAEAMGLAKDAKATADAANEQAKKAQSAVDGIDHEKIFNLLTEDGTQQGVFKKDGKIYINVEYLEGGTIAADLIDGSTLIIKKGSTIAGWNIDNYSIFKTPDGKEYKDGTFMHVGTDTAYSIGGSDEIPGWVFGAGGKFGVTKDGAVYAESGKIGGWYIHDEYLSNSPLADMGGTVRLYPDRVTYALADDIVYSATWEQIILTANQQQEGENNSNKT